MKNLVIVESPAKAKTIEKFLGKDYTVTSSYGHIRDLRKKDFSIDVDNDFTPVYEIPEDKKELVRRLKKEASQADMVWLASDEDREGEAIAWHLYEVLGLKPENTRRIVFHEITKPAILAAIANPRGIDIDRVNAQQARRVLDRMVGFELSPVLWRKIKPALSAGRVQSVAVRLICEREKEIAAFQSEQYYRLAAVFAGQGAKDRVKAELNKRLPDAETARRFMEQCSGATFRVSKVETKPVKRSPMPPFTTSTLQQEASRRLGMSVSQTMMVAQELYEKGHITYMRTDSLNLSNLALKDIADTISADFGKQYLHTRQWHTKSKGAQEAHEAIRPTYISHATIEGTAQEKRLYELIRRRTLACQMADAEIEKTSVHIDIEPGQLHAPLAGEYFEASGEVPVFDGFLKVYASADSADSTRLPALHEGDMLDFVQITATERRTLAPARYTEASLVKKMEELGIGRPSTYAPTISTIQSRDYVKRGENEGEQRLYSQLVLSPGQDIVTTTLTEKAGSDKGRLVPTDVGMVVNDFLTEKFPDILDYNFTARVEEKFDEISEGKLGWQKEIKDFYGDFHPLIAEVNATRSDHKVGERVLGTDPKSGKPVSVKIGRFGPVVQIGEATYSEKPAFASLLPGQSMRTLTLEQALKLFELPRTVGELDGKPVTAAIGRFGPYVKYGSLFVSIPKDMAPQTITLDQARQLIEAKQLQESQKHIKTFEDFPEAEVLNGRYGPYIAYKPEGAKKAVNYKIPKGTDPKSLTADEVRAIMKAQDEAPAKPRRPRAKKS